MKLLVLTAPQGVLKLYIATSKATISVVLIIDRSNKQEPVYFVSGTLQEAEARYPPLDKLALALIVVAQCI